MVLARSSSFDACGAMPVPGSITNVFSQQGIPSVAKKIPQGGGEFVLPDLAECGMALGQNRVGAGD